MANRTVTARPLIKLRPVMFMDRCARRRTLLTQKTCSRRLFTRPRTFHVIGDIVKSHRIQNSIEEYNVILDTK